MSVNDPGELLQPEQPPNPELSHQFEVETAFSDGLAEIVPDAVRRLRFLERGIKYTLDRTLILHRSVPGLDLNLTIEGGHGLLITEAGMGIPECLVSFEFDPSEVGSRRVNLWGIRLVEPLDPAEDFS